MAKAEVLADRIKISSDVLTNENLRKAEMLKPSVLNLRDEEIDTILYGIANAEPASFTKYGATFNDGVSLGAINDRIMRLEKEERDKEIKLFLSDILIKINAIEEQVSAFIEEAAALDEEIEIDIIG